MRSTSLNELSGLLWRERDVLDIVISRIGGGDDGWEALLRSVSSLELHRAITAREAALELGLSGDATLDEIAAAAPREWASILRGHGHALRELTAELSRLVDGNGRVAPGAGLSGPVMQRSLRDFLSA